MPIAREPQPSSESLQRALAAVIREGPAGIWSKDAQALLRLPIISSRITDVADPETPEVVDAALEAALDRMASPEYREMMRVLLGLSSQAQGRSAAERRALAGESFRGGERPVAAGTIRTYHEPRAIEMAAEALLGLPHDLPQFPIKAEEQNLGNQRTCFVIGPIGSKHAPIGSSARTTWEDSLRVMEEIIEPACAHYGLAAVRADSLARPGEITTQVFRRLRDDDIVIADLTDANPNVMYELGLRHTQAKLTIQIGEYGRLPFDISTIRTIQFSQSTVGRINARDELISVLERGLDGDYDAVPATVIWNDHEPPSSTPVAVVEANTSPEKDGLVDILAEAEASQDAIAPALEAVGLCIVEMGDLTTRSTKQLQRSDAAGKGMRGRLQVLTAYADGLSTIADRLDDAVGQYEQVLDPFAKGTLALIGQLEKDPEAMGDEGTTYGMVVRRAASVTRDVMSSLAELVEAVRSNAETARVLREPSRRLTAALDRFVDATSVIDEWDRRLQGLGVPMPPDGWNIEKQGDITEVTQQ